MRASALAASAAKASNCGSPYLRVAQAEVAAEHQQVLGHGEIGVQVVDLRHHAQARPRLPGLRRHGVAQHLDGSAVKRRQAQQGAQGRGLAGAVGAQQAVAFAAPQREGQAVDDHALAVALGQAVHLQDRRA